MSSKLDKLQIHIYLENNDLIYLFKEITKWFLLFIFLEHVKIV